MTNQEQGRRLSFDRAKQGDQVALGQLLAEHRDWLHRMAQGELRGPLSARLSASDVVQQTCLSAIRQFSAFDGASEAEFRVWLKGVHRHNIQDAVRKHGRAQRRTVGGQQSLDAGGSAAAPAAPSVSPSGQILRKEAADRVLEAIATLPNDQATAVRLRHLEQRSLREIAGAMNRTEVAVASLLKRGLEALRQRIRRPEDA
jgi:RNA polymerase sigma-70 factor, ECF subfamily